jgi:DNA-binding MarR family transcriptional regulator
VIPELLGNSLGFNVHRTALLFRRELVRALAGLELSPEQWQLLAILDHAGKPLPQVELVRELLRDKPTVSRILQRMERRGWIAKRGSPADARVTLVALTPSGRRVAREAPGRIQAHFDRKLAFLSEPDLAAAIALLKRLQKGLE